MRGRGWDPELIHGVSNGGDGIWWILGIVAVFLVICILNPDNYRHADSCNCKKCKGE